MRFLRHFPDDLFIERHAALVPANLGQQSVVEPLPPTEPATGKIKSYRRDENQVQLV